MTIRFLLSFLFVGISATYSYGQVPTVPKTSSSTHPNQFSPRACGANIWDAGTSNQALATSAQSNDVQFLCFNDALEITHDGNFNLNPAADPDMSTPAGISYVFYSCPPSVTGPDITDVEADTCIVNTPPPSGTEQLYLDGVVDAGGNGIFLNNGGLQTFFNGGAPVEFYFAPITIHDHAALTFESPASNVDDFCVNVNVSDAFRVVYLNAIQESNIIANACGGTFEINGGVSEFDALNGSSSNYTISITQNGNAAVTGAITSGTASHGSNVTFTVPEPGIYDVSVEDGKSCGATFQVDMSACPSTLGATASANDVVCNGQTNGSIDVNITGGVAGYTIEWNTIPPTTLNTGSQAGTGTFNIGGLAAGDYSITVTDNAGTEVIIPSTTVNEPGLLGVNLDQTQPLCNGDATGSITAEVFLDGVLITPDASYSFTWNPSLGTGQTLSNIPSGAYALTVTDGNGCEATASTTLSQPPAISGAISETNAACVGVNNGSANISASGGTGTLSYLWDSGQTTPSITGLAPGNYVVTVTDDNNCTIIRNTTIGTNTTLTATAAATDITCNGDNDGTVTATPTATGVDNGGYTYAWNPNVGSTPTVSSLPPNTYNVTITDALGCTATASDIVNEPIALSVTTNVIDESCTVGGDGQVTAIPSGGTIGTGYAFLWNTGETTQTISNLSANTYTVAITDANNCTVIGTGTVMTPQGPLITSFDSISVACATDVNGSLTVNATAGSTPINGYTWSNGQSGPTATGLGPGTYTVSVTDDGGCITTGSATLSAPPALAENAAPLVTFPSCPGDGDATITLDITGGVPPYNYIWSNGASGPSTNPLTNIVAGTYSVLVIDANLCEYAINNIVVNDPPPINVVFQNVLPVSCNGAICDGSATIIASGGLSTTYTFTWASGETSTGGSSTAVNLCQGNQSVTVTDGICTQVFQMDTDSVPAPPFVSVSDIDVTNATCFGDTDGTVTVTPTGGSGSGYTFNWSNGQTSPTATNLDPNLNYTVIVTDGLGCVSVPIDIRVGEPDLLELLIIDTVDVSCAGLGDGSIQVAPLGGNPGTFTYQWSPNTTDNTNIATNLSPGIYSVTVTDELGCTATNFAVISEPDPIVFEYTPPVEPICNGFATVFAFDTVYGGNGPYTYTIDQFNFQPTTQSAQIFAGTYTIAVTDSTNCTITEDITINEPPAILVNLGPDVEIQLGESYEIIPVVTPLSALDSILWTPGTSLSCTDCFNPTASPTEDITYTLTVTDSNGCFGSDDILIDIDPNRNVYIPTAFSPNQDGTNDIFSPLVGTGVTNIRKMQVFDRWGELVYLQNNFLPDALGTQGWNGTFQGKNMNPAVFIYTIEVEFADGRVLTYKGDITLLR